MTCIDNPAAYLPRSRLSWLVIVLWIIIISVSLIWNWIGIKSNFIDIARENARISLEKDKIYRQWVIMNGGVYVSVTDKTPPNPHLSHIPDRDIKGPDGKDLTLVNPAYMSRLLWEMFSAENHLHVHITSLKPLRPENAPDQWEKNALKAFQGGLSEASGIQVLNNRPYYRLMQPFITDTACLKCHRHQGYQTGDILGGLSVAIPMAPYLKASGHQRTLMCATHLLVGSFVLFGLMTGARKLENEHRNNRNLLQRYELIMEGAAGGIWDWSVPEKRVFFSPVWKAMRGYREDEISDSETEWSAGIHPEDNDRVMASVQAHFDGKSKVFDEAYRVCRKDGSWIWIHDRGKALRDNTGHIIRMAGSEVDITEHVRDRNALKLRELKYRTLAEASPSGIWQTDEKGDCIFVSFRWTEITGMSKENARGRGWLERIHPDEKEKIRSDWYRHASTRQSYRAEFRFVRPNGATVWVLCTARPEIDDKDIVSGWIGTITDITTEKKIQAERERLIRKLETAMADIKTLNQLLPICSSCKKIRDDKGYWNQIESYISKHSQAQFSHSICPDCAEKLYPDLEPYPGK